jgi:hypothetical protein
MKLAMVLMGLLILNAGCGGADIGASAEHGSGADAVTSPTASPNDPTTDTTGGGMLTRRRT